LKVFETLSFKKEKGVTGDTFADLFAEKYTKI